MVYTKQKRLFFIIIIGLFLLAGCANQSQDMKTDLNIINDDASKLYIDSQKEIYSALGAKIKELSDIPGIEDPAILVNGHPITKKDIENEKIRSEFSNSFSLKEKINELIRKKVEIAEANRLEIKPVQDDLNAYLERTKQAIESNANANAVLQAYIEGRNITKEAYFELLYDQEYINYQRMAWWDAVNPREKILFEAKERNVDVNIVDAEYHNRYVDELVKKADIEYLDPEIEEIMK